MTDLDPRPMLARFGLDAASITPVSGGHINASWRAGSCLIQRINPVVFPRGELVVGNVALVCDQLQRAAQSYQLGQREILQLVRAPGGEPGLRSEDGAWWRVVRFIEGTRTFQRADSPEMAFAAGRAFGLFQRLLAGYSGPALAETIPGFHDTIGRVKALQDSVRRNATGRVGQVEPELRFAAERAGYIAVVLPLMQSGQLPLRVVHNDAKIANVLFDESSDQALAVIDLDTVMPGTLLFDVGDLIRSMASPTDEDEPDVFRIVVSKPMVESLIRGYVEGCGGVLTETERRLLIFSGILLSYEQGVRFLTDYLDGDRYYKIARPGQNLDRARAQFALVAELERCRASLERQVEAIVRGER